MGICERWSGTPVLALDQLELLIDALALLDVGISEEEGIAKATGLKGIRSDHHPLETDQVHEEVKVDGELLSREDGVHGEELATEHPLENHQSVTSGGPSQCLPKREKMVLAGDQGVAEEA